MQPTRYNRPEVTDVGEHDIRSSRDPEALRLFMKRLLADLQALERMIAEGRIERGPRRIGAEQELFLVDRQRRPAPIAPALLEKLGEAPFTTELGLFNLEINLPPLEFAGDCLSRLESDLSCRIARVRDAAALIESDVCLIGILPTLREADLTDENMTPNPRYAALSEALRAVRGEAFEFRVTGSEELILRHDSVMLEACNTSWQIHFQAAPDEFARLYNIAQLASGPVLAAAVNSPLMLGKRLWAETRIAVFQQAFDTRVAEEHVQERAARVWFGKDWVRESAVEIFRDDITRFRPLVAWETDEQPLEMLERGEVPKLRALQLHNSTVYRWNRPCYGITGGRPHLRIENRALPAGPTVADEVANAAFWFGLVHGLAERGDEVSGLMDFAAARANFMDAAHSGLDAHLTWIDGSRYPAAELIRRHLVGLAEKGLRAAKIHSGDIDRYLTIIDQRAATRRTGARWLLESLENLKNTETALDPMAALVAGCIERQRRGRPVHTWKLAGPREAGRPAQNFLRVEQCMSTDLFTVHQDDAIDLAASVMDWRKVRHVPVEDGDRRLVGVVSYRSLLRFLAQDKPHGRDNPVPVRDVMNPEPVTVAPETPTLEAIELMRERGIGCLPVVREDRLVGILTEADMLRIAAELLERTLERELGDDPPADKRGSESKSGPPPKSSEPPTKSSEPRPTTSEPRPRQSEPRP